MTSDKPPITIKKYANRRLYHTGTSAYVTLEDLATMVKHGEDFLVFDAKSGEDITRSVLTQIIFEQEGKRGQSLLPVSFLRQLIRFYGDSMQMLVPSYLELSLDKLTADKGGFREQWIAAAGNAPFAPPHLTQAALPLMMQIEEQTRQNMVLFRQALGVFAPFGPRTDVNNGGTHGAAAAASEPRMNGSRANGSHPDGSSANGMVADGIGTDDSGTDGNGADGNGADDKADGAPPRDEIGDMKRQLDDLQRRIETLAAIRE